MAKALYTKVHDRYFKINQKDVNVPVLLMPFHNIMDNASVQTRDGQCDVDINTVMASDLMLTNKELSDEMFKDLKEKRITQIDDLDDRYMMSINYSIINPRTNKETSRFESVEALKSTEMLVPQGVDSRNECLYRRIKKFENTHAFVFHDMHRFGVTKAPTCGCKFRINDITIYQCTKGDQSMNNNSVFGIPFEHRCNTIRKVCDGKIRIYSSSRNHVEFAPIEFKHQPKCVHLHITCFHGDIITIYDDCTVSKILEENIKQNENDQEGITDGIFINTAEQFMCKYAPILALTYTTVTEDHRKTIEEALRVANTLAPEEQGKLEAQVKKINNLKKVIDGEAPEGVAADGITVDEKGVSLTYQGQKIGDPAPIEKLADEINADAAESGTSGVVTTVDI